MKLQSLLKLVIAVVVVFALVKLAGNVQMPAWLPGGDAPRLAVVSVECLSGDGLPRAEVLVRNIGDSPLEAPVGVMRFGDLRQRGQFVPRTIGPEGEGYLVIYPEQGDASGCELESVADKDGNETPLTRRPKVTNPRDRVHML